MGKAWAGQAGGGAVSVTHPSRPDHERKPRLEAQVQGPGAKRLRMPKAGKAIPHIRGFRSVAGALQSPRVSVLEQSLLWVLFSDVPREWRWSAAVAPPAPGREETGSGVQGGVFSAERGEGKEMLPVGRLPLSWPPRAGPARRGNSEKTCAAAPP